MVRIALIGCGRIGQMHAANIAKHQHTELSLVFDVDEKYSREVAQLYGAKVAESVSTIFEAEDIEGVLIASVTSTHAKFIEMAVAAGKPVLCEKPIDLNLDRVNRCANKIAGTSVPIQMGFNRRFDPGHKAARNAVIAGEIGELHQVIITARDPEIPSKSYLEKAGGLFRDMTIHDFDLARFMLGQEPVEVFAIGDPLGDPKLGGELNEVDTAMFILRTASGKQCHINNSRNAVYGYDQRVELMGSNGMLISGNRKPNELRRYGKNGVETSTPYQFFFIERYREAFMAEIDGFVDCIRHHKEPLSTFEDGRKALVLAETAYRSMHERRLVSVSEVDDCWY